jgi:hypothetical protein
MERTDLAQESDKHGAAANAINNLWVPQNVRNFLACCGSSARSIKTLLNGVKLHFNIITSTAPNSIARSSWLAYSVKVCSARHNLEPACLHLKTIQCTRPTETQAVSTKATVRLVFKATKNHASIHYRYFEYVGVRFGTARTKHALLLTFLAISSSRTGPTFMSYFRLWMTCIRYLNYVILESPCTVWARATTGSSRRRLLTSSITQRTHLFQCRSVGQRKTQRNNANMSSRMRQ